MITSKNMRGATLVEVFIIITVLSGVLLMLMIGASRGCAVMSENPHVKEDALRYARELGLKNPQASCAEYDTDSDGYISCTIAAEDRVLAVECAAGGPLNVQKGCRLQKPRIQHADLRQHLSKRSCCQVSLHSGGHASMRLD